LDKVKVEEELKRKRAELLSEIEELKLRIETTKKQVAAIDEVIALYDPAHMELLVVRTERKRARQEVPILHELARLNKTTAILEALRGAGQPASSADCANRIALKHGVAADDPALPRLRLQIEYRAAAPLLGQVSAH
jgi:predicted transcriptional regulator